MIKTWLNVQSNKYVTPTVTLSVLFISDEAHILEVPHQENANKIN